MGIGVSLAFVAIGSILAFALRVDMSGINIQMVGWILILVGVVSMAFTLLYTRPRRRAGQIVGADPAYGDQSGNIVRQERIVEQPVERDRPVERVERVIERPVPPQGPAVGQDPHSMDPARAQDPSIAQDPAEQNRAPRSPRRPPASREL